MKIEDVKTPHTLGWPSYILLVKFVDIDSTEEVVNLFEVELEKPRNLNTHVTNSQIHYSHMVTQK